MYWGQTESSRWSLDSVSRNLSHPATSARARSSYYTSISTPATALLAGSTVALSIGSAGTAVAVATGSRESEVAVAESAAASGTRALSSGRVAGRKSTYGVASKLGVSD